MGHWVIKPEITHFTLTVEAMFRELDLTIRVAQQAGRTAILEIDDKPMEGAYVVSQLQHIVNLPTSIGESSVRAIALTLKNGKDPFPLRFPMPAEGNWELEVRTGESGVLLIYRPSHSNAKQNKYVLTWQLLTA